ncbi:MAG: RHS repeat-associated core domain-containing protein [Pseudomonadota bacterium]|nr:RHS repeat-associated core domain-containing protein [Pseudomonadota bacterium]
MKMLCKAKSLLACILLTSHSISSFANEDIEPIVEWEKKQNAEQRLEVFGNDFLGDSIDPHTGSLVFNHTDVSLPGNSSLSVALTRRRTSGFHYKDGTDVEFGDWTLSVPRLSVTSLTIRAWQGNRCSLSTDALLGNYSNGKTFLSSRDFSNGIQLEVPGQGSQQLLDDNGAAIWPTNAKKVTKQNWYFTCGAASDGGEGFIGHAPNGNKYRFDKAYSIDAPLMGFIGANPMPRKIYIIAATQVTDVNGNWVKYQYDNLNRVTAIHANDGRRIDLHYSGNSKLVRSASAAGETWRYDYSLNRYQRDEWMPLFGQALRGQSLAKVTQPDGYYWAFNLDGLSATPAPSGRDHCQKWQHTVSLKHPYGATGTFTIKDIEHRHVYASQVRRSETCLSGEPEAPVQWGSFLPLDNDVTTSTMAVIEKSVTGPSMETATWQYQYENDVGPSGSSSDDRTNWTKVSAPDGHYTYYHAWVSEPLAGKLVKKETRASASSAVLKTESYTYLREIAIGHSHMRGYSSQGDLENPIHTTKIVTTQDGDTFTQEYSFNTSHSSSSYSYANPTMTSIKSNVSTTARKTLTVYSHNKNKWVLGLPIKQTVNGRVTQESSYDSLGRKTSDRRNGALFATYGYHSDGSFAWAKDANNRILRASNYKRGTPQKITRANGDYVNQYVDDFGRISEIVDANGNKTSFTRDTMGRLLTADFPDNWASVTHEYSFNGSPVQTIKRSDMQTVITYDAMFRPVLVATKDLITNKTTYINSKYDKAGRETFVSFPSSSSMANTGISTEYDGLGRITKKRETVYPYAETSTSYHAQHRRTETDAIGNKTHYYHYGYDGATYQDIKAIHSPLGLYTNINKNVWGEITSIKQWGSQGGFVTGDDSSSDGGNDSGDGSDVSPITPTNPGDIIITPPGIDPIASQSTSSFSSDDSSTSSGVSFTRNYYYNAQRRLCRISQADVGDTLYQYDTSGWLTAYQNGASRGTNCATPSGSGKVTLVRDEVGRITKRDYADSLTPDITKTYDANGNVKTVNRNGINWRYSYNSINLPTSELLSVDGREYAISYGYSNAGYMSRMTYPTGKTINYNPDGLGRPRQANWGSTYYANHINYHANGQISSLSYGNGYTYKQLLNARQLPERLLSTKGTTKALDLTYSYDKRHLITSVTDAATSGNNRNMSYDALERLTSSTGPWGNGHISYDSLGNILTKNLGSRYVSMSYDESNRLIRTNDSGGLGGNTGDRRFSYDSRGNITSSGNIHFTYDYSDQPVGIQGDESGSYLYDGNLKRVKATVSGKTIYNVYNLAGQLIHIDDVSTGKRTDYVNAGSMTIARVMNNVPTYVHHDIVGSPVTGTNRNGTIAWRERYTPFGITLDNESANDDQAGYTGHIKDSNTGLVYMQARYYDPVIGRFLSNDPVGTLSHFNGRNGIQGFNRYAYANNNPYKYIDPDGKAVLNPATGAAGGFAVGGPVGGVIGFLAGSAAVYFTVDQMAEAFDEINQMSESSDVGSYTNTHESGKTYHGKGSRKRSQQSGRRKARQHNDPHVATDWTSSANDREAFKDESKRLDEDGGAESDSNYNEVESPGKKYREEDGDS